MKDQRTKDLAKIHVAKTVLGLSDDDYRAMLQAVAGVRSARDLDAAGIARVQQHLRRAGFVARPAGGAARGNLRVVETPLVKKVRALWLHAASMGAVRNAHEDALVQFARTITRAPTLTGARAYELGKVVEAIKAMVARHQAAQQDAAQ